MQHTPKRVGDHGQEVELVASVANDARCVRVHPAQVHPRCKQRHARGDEVARGEDAKLTNAGNGDNIEGEKAVAQSWSVHRNDGCVTKNLVRSDGERSSNRSGAPQRLVEVALVVRGQVHHQGAERYARAADEERCKECPAYTTRARRSKLLGSNSSNEYEHDLKGELQATGRGMQNE